MTKEEIEVLSAVDLDEYYVDMIVAHNPAKLSENSTMHYYVGSTPFHKLFVLIYNPKTHQTIVRSSFQQ